MLYPESLTHLTKNYNWTSTKLKHISGFFDYPSYVRYFIKGIKGQSSKINTNTIEKINASQIIADTLMLLEFKFKRSQCILVTDIDDSVILSGNPRGLSQIVTNLVDNALEASEGKIITVTVKLKLVENNVKLIVEDTGPGISEENLIRIFDPLFTTKPFGESSGLGLGIVKDLVTQFNGIITVKSNKGITQFLIELPLNGTAN